MYVLIASIILKLSKKDRFKVNDVVLHAVACCNWMS